VGLTALVLGRVTGADFVLWDDTVEIYKNGYFNPPSWESLGFLWTHPYLEQYVPLTDSVWSLLSNLAHLDTANPTLSDSGALLDPHLFHLANLFVHLLNVCLVFAILRRLCDSTLPAAAGALLFGIHPLQVESVAWVSEMRGLLAGFFSLLAILLYIRQARSENRFEYGLALAAALAAMLSKPSAAALPFGLMVLDRWALRRPWPVAARSLALFFVLSLPFLLVAPIVQPVAAGLAAPIWQRPFVAADALAFYVVKLVFPAALGIDYGRPPAVLAANWWGYATWLLPAAIGALVFWFQRRVPGAIPAVLLPVAALLPVLGFVPFAFQHYSTVADRYFYLAMLGPALGLALFLSALPAVRRPAAVAVVSAGLVAFAVAAFVQAGTWESTTTLMRHAISVNPRSDVAYNNLGIVLGREGRYAEATAALRTSIHLNAGEYKAHSNLGNVLFLERRPDEAIAEYRASIAINGGWDESHANLGNALSSQGKWQEAVDEYRTALRLNPGSASAQKGLDRALRGLQTGR